jgi:uncharacterized damage-inducible protein DinB
MARNGRDSAHLLSIFDQAYNKKSWHGTNLRGSVRGLTPGQAEWRPAPDRHNIHELVLHAAYWKYAVANRLGGGRRGSFPLKGSNWFTPAPEPPGWTAAVALMDSVHRDLRTVIERVITKDMDTPLPDSTTTPFELVSGIVAHDLYHAGQIQFLKVLQRSQPGSSRRGNR